MFRLPAANVKISCCQTVKRDSSRKVWEKKVKRGGVELKPGGGNPEEATTHAQHRPGDGNRRNKIPGSVLSLLMTGREISVFSLFTHLLNTVFDGPGEPKIK